MNDPEQEVVRVALRDLAEQVEALADACYCMAQMQGKLYPPKLLEEIRDKAGDIARILSERIKQRPR